MRHTQGRTALETQRPSRRRPSKPAQTRQVWRDANQIPAAGAIRLSVATHIPAVLCRLGFEVEPIIKQAGFSLAMLDRPDTIIPYAAMGRLLEVSARAAQCPHIGLLAGQCCGIPTLGPLGLLLERADTVGAALRDLAAYLHLHDRGAVVGLSIQDDMAVLSYAFLTNDIPGMALIADGAIAVGCNIMRSFCGPQWAPTEVRLPRRRPLELRPYQQFFRAPIRFNSDQAALVFPANTLDQRLRGAHWELHRFIESSLAVESIETSLSVKCGNC